MAQYDGIVPGAANRILAMAEEQSEHRRLLERTVVVSDARRANWGLAAGVGVTFAFLFVCHHLIMAGHEITGALLGVANVGALAGVFIYGSSNRKRERVEKAKIMAEKE